MKLTALAIVLLIAGCQSYTIAPELDRISNAAIREAYKGCAIDAQINGSDEDACKKQVIADLIKFGNQILSNAQCVKRFDVKNGGQL